MLGLRKIMCWSRINDVYKLSNNLPSLINNCKSFCQSYEQLKPEDSIAKKIADNIRTTHGLMYDHNIPQFSHVCQKLREMYEVEDDILIQNVIREPSLTSYSLKQFDNVIRILLECGFQLPKIFKLLSKCPQVLETPTPQLEDVFNTLRKRVASGKHIRNVISGEPMLLITSATFIDSQFEHLIYLFPQCDIKKLIWTTPNILFDDMEITEGKLTFIIHEMRVKHEDISDSYVLSMSLHQIKKRFEFLIRTGFYKKVHPKLVVKNPSISDMMDIPMRDLVEKRVGVSWEEFLVFEKIFDKDYEAQTSDNESSDEE